MRYEYKNDYEYEPPNIMDYASAWDRIIAGAITIILMMLGAVAGYTGGYLLADKFGTLFAILLSCTFVAIVYLRMMCLCEWVDRPEEDVLYIPYK